jgi:hypothetical protein
MTENEMDGSKSCTFGLSLVYTPFDEILCLENFPLKPQFFLYWLREEKYSPEESPAEILKKTSLVCRKNQAHVLF